MIDMKQLRIGNNIWMETYEWDKEKNRSILTEDPKPFRKMITIEANHLVAMTDGAKHYFPINLTDDIMTQFGFKPREQFKFHKKLLVLQDRGLGNWVAAQFDQIDGKGHLLQNLLVWHVHQLQNLYFALYGEELPMLSLERIKL